MKKIFIYIVAFVLNIGLYFFLQIVSSFVQFGLFGSGNTSAEATVWGSLSFLLLQVLTLVFLYKKKILIKDMPLLILNIVVALGLFLYFMVYLADT